MSEQTKGERTKARILTEASTLFSEQAFDRVSVRAIAKEANVDPALINHYFGSKEGLFAALVETYLKPRHIEESLLAIPTIDEWGRQLVRAVDTAWSTSAGQVMLAVARRGLAENTEMLRDTFTPLLLDRIASSLEGSDSERHLRASLAASQMVGLITTRYIVRLEPLASMPREKLVDLIGPTIQHYLTGQLTQ